MLSTQVKSITLCKGRNRNMAKKTAAQKAADEKAAEKKAAKDAAKSTAPDAAGTEPAESVNPEAGVQPDTTNPVVTDTEVGVPAGLEPTPGVDTTAEHNAKKYGQPLPEGVTKEVLDEQGNPKPAAAGKAKKGKSK